MELTIDCRAPVYFKIKDVGDDQIAILATVEGVTQKVKIIDADVENLDFENKSGEVVGKLRFSYESEDQENAKD